MKTFKETVLQHFRDQTRQRVNMLQAQADSMQEALQHETKSTAGDKYETGRAMLHLEQEQLAAQLAKLLQQKAALDSLSASGNTGGKARPGSLVETDKGFFFISAPVGKALVEGHTVFAVSPAAPLGKLLLDAAVGDTLTLQGISYKIKDIT